MRCHLWWQLALFHLELGDDAAALNSIGGSHAQRDLFEQLYLDALRRSGRLAAVQNLLQPRVNAQPQSLQLRRQPHEVHAALGLPVLAHH